MFDVLLIAIQKKGTNLQRLRTILKYFWRFEQKSLVSYIISIGPTKKEYFNVYVNLPKKLQCTDDIHWNLHEDLPDGVS